MKEPWQKSGGWPYQGARGRTWQLGFRNHEGRVRSRSFRTREAANAWRKAYVEAERHRVLRTFLLGSDAPEVRPDDTPLGELVAAWLSGSAHPDEPNGLAPATWDSYRSVASRHIAGNPTMRWVKPGGEWTQIEIRPAIAPLGIDGGYAIGHLPAAEFSTSTHLSEWLAAMRTAGVSRASEERAWKALSSALSWAASDKQWPLVANGCLVMQRTEGQQRRSARRSGTGAKPKPLPRKQNRNIAAWALSPLAIERIRLVMLERTKRRPPLAAMRDAFTVSLQAGLGLRNQEVWPVTVGSVSGGRACILQVLSGNELDDGKTLGATSPNRQPPIDVILAQDIREWTEMLREHGFVMGDDDYLVRGDLAGRGGDGGIMTASQVHKWSSAYFKPAVEIVAARWPEEHVRIAGATQYALRRGAISLRIRAGEDRQQIASECGTSVEMLERHYSFALTELRDRGPRSAAEERRHARERALTDLG